MFWLVRELRKVPEKEDVVAGNLLRQFLLECWGISGVQRHVVRGLLYFESRTKVPNSKREARTGSQ